MLRIRELRKSSIAKYAGKSIRIFTFRRTQLNGHYFTWNSWPNFIPFPICGIWFYGRYAHEIGIIVFVSHYLSSRASNAGAGMRSDYSEEAVGSVPRSSSNDRDVRIADNAVRKTRHEFFMSHLAPKNSATNPKTFGQIDKKLMTQRCVYRLLYTSNLYLIMIRKFDDLSSIVKFPLKTKKIYEL